MKQTLRDEFALPIGILTVTIFLTTGRPLLADLSLPLRNLILFVWLISVMLWLSFKVIHHADALAIIPGEPYGTLILTLSVISIEVIVKR